MTSAAAPRRDFAHGGLPSAAWPVFQAVFLASGFAASSAAGDPGAGTHAVCESASTVSPP